MQPEDNLAPNTNSSPANVGQMPVQNSVPTSAAGPAPAPITPNLVPNQAPQTNQQLNNAAVEPVVASSDVNLGTSSTDAMGGYATPPQSVEPGQTLADNLNSSQSQAEQAPTNSASANDLMGAGVISPTDTGSFMQESPQPEVPKKGGAKKILLALVGVAIGIALFFGVMFGVARLTKTSAATLQSFSEATSGLTSEGTELASSVSKTTYSSTSEDIDLESDVKEFDEAVKKFEDATTKLKSDKKELKAAAESYIAEIKSYQENVIGLAVDNAKLQAVAKELSDFKFSSSASSSMEAFAAEADKASTTLAGTTQKMKDLSLSNEKAKELRDLYVSLIGEMQTFLKNVKTDALANNRSAILDEISKFSTTYRNHPALAKEDEIDDTLSFNSDANRKLEEARVKLNEEITKVNS